MVLLPRPEPAEAFAFVARNILGGPRTCAGQNVGGNFYDIVERAELTERLRKLEQKETAAPLERDPAQKWIEEHRDEVRQHRGESIAVHPLHGIVASGNDYGALLAAIRERGLEQEVLITFVSATGG